MKKIITIAFAITAFLACQNQARQGTEAAESHVHFANKTDYICGMEVQADWTDTCTYKGNTYAFCAASCKEEFLKDPEKYLAAK
jgi:YHS domain-containing protein